MPNYYYEAINDSGAKVTGTIEAANPEALDNILAGRGLIPSKSREVAGAKGAPSRLDLMLARVKPADLILFTKQLATMLRAGVPILRLFGVLEQQTSNKKLKYVCSSLMGEIQGGASLFEAFNKHPRVFSHLYRSMIAAGEASGSLPDVLERLIYIIQHEFKVKQDIRSALAYPIIVVITLAIAFFILLTFVVPKFAAIFKSAGIDLPMPTRVAMAMYSFLDNYWYLLLGAVAAVVVGLGMYFKTEQGRFVRDSLLIQVPLLGPLFIKSAMSRFASIFAILQASGVSVLDSLRILSDTINNAAISREFDRLETQLKEGRGISQPLRSARYFTPMIINMVAIGEESGNLDEMLRESAEHYDHEVEYAVGQLTTAMGPILVVALAGVVGFFALAIFLPMWDLVKTVQM